MVAIQRALGDYLEKQRSDFSRFYFLGDDDLLEIIGNSGEPGKVLSHVGKMFAGISSIRSKDVVSVSEYITALFDAMISKDGEVVPLNDVIEVSKKLPVKDWLKDLEVGMQNTLANSLLRGAVSEDSSATGRTEKTETFVEWAKKFPAQEVMILATTLINWSMGVDNALQEGDSKLSLGLVLEGIEQKLQIMAKTVLLDLPRPEERKKFAQRMTE